MFSGAYSEERVQGSQPSDQPEMHTLGRESGYSRGRPKEAVGLLGRQTSQLPPPGPGSRSWLRRIQQMLLSESLFSSRYVKGRLHSPPRWGVFFSSLLLVQHLIPS